MASVFTFDSVDDISKVPNTMCDKTSESEEIPNSIQQQDFLTM